MNADGPRRLTYVAVKLSKGAQQKAFLERGFGLSVMVNPFRHANLGRRMNWHTWPVSLCRGGFPERKQRLFELIEGDVWRQYGHFVAGHNLAQVQLMWIPD